MGTDQSGTNERVVICCTICGSHFSLRTHLCKQVTLTGSTVFFFDHFEEILKVYEIVGIVN